MSHDEIASGPRPSFSFPVSSLEQLAADFATGRLTPEQEDEVIARIRADEAFRRLVVPIANRCVAPERERPRDQRRTKRGQENHDRRSAAVALEQVLNDLGAEWCHADFAERLGFYFDLLDEGVLVACSASIGLGRVINLQVHTGLAMYAGGAALKRWVRRWNRGQMIERLVYDRLEDEYFLQSMVQCADLPNELLPTVLAHAIASLMSVWRRTEPRFRRLLGVPDNRWPGIPLDGPPDDFRWRGSYDRPRTVAIDCALLDAVKRACGEEVSRSLRPVLEELGTHFASRLDAAGVAHGLLELCIERTEHEAVLTLEAPGVEPLHFRFDPAEILARVEADARGLTLYHHATAAHANDCLRGRFREEPVVVRDDVLADLLRYHRYVDLEGGPLTAVVLTDQPLALAERGDRTEVIRVLFPPEHHTLWTSEVLDLVISDSEAWVASDGPRRWLVTGDELEGWVLDREVKVAHHDSPVA